MGRWVVPDRWMTKGEAALQLGKKLLVVWGGIRGEEAEIRVVGETRSQLHGTWVRAREPSPHRVEPICERYALCGGCPLMHVDTAGQVEARRWLVGSALRAAGLARLEVSSVHASPVGSEGYRHCIRLGFGLSDHSADQGANQLLEGHDIGHRITGHAEKRRVVDFSDDNRFSGHHGHSVNQHFAEVFENRSGIVLRSG